MSDMERQTLVNRCGAYSTHVADWDRQDYRRRAESDRNFWNAYAEAGKPLSSGGPSWTGGAGSGEGAAALMKAGFYVCLVSLAVVWGIEAWNVLQSAWWSFFQAVEAPFTGTNLVVIAAFVGSAFATFVLL
jgi:hypothetical protein